MNRVNTPVKLLLIALLAMGCESLRSKDPHGKETVVSEQNNVHSKKDTNSHGDSHHARKAGPISADQSFQWLRNGNERFLSGKTRKDGASRADIIRLSTGQQPHAIVLSCSDSRVPPEVVFDQKLGEIFTVRTAGQSLNHTDIASIEYAIAHLGSNLIIVMGHTSCGAVKAAHSTQPGADAGSPHLNELVKDIHPRIHSHLRKPASANYIQEGWDNTNGVAKDLLERSAIVREAVASGQVKIKTGLYFLNTGKVEFQN